MWGILDGAPAVPICMHAAHPGELMNTGGKEWCVASVPAIDLLQLAAAAQGLPFLCSTALPLQTPGYVLQLLFIKSVLTVWACRLIPIGEDAWMDDPAKKAVLWKHFEMGKVVAVKIHKVS